MAHARPEVHRVGDLEIDEHIGFQRRSWRVQWIAQTGIVLIVLAGLIGFFGGGGVANATAEVGSVRVEYPRFMRAHVPVEIRVFLADDARDPGATSITIDAAFFDAFTIEQVSPKPEKETLGAGGIVFEFARSAGAHGPIIWQVKSTQTGLRSAAITVEGEPTVLARPFIYP